MYTLPPLHIIRLSFAFAFFAAWTNAVLCASFLKYIAFLLFLEWKKPTVFKRSAFMYRNAVYVSFSSMISASGIFSPPSITIAFAVSSIFLIVPSACSYLPPAFLSSGTK